MSQRYPSALLEDTVNKSVSLPGVGRKTAFRLALYMLHQGVSCTKNLVMTLVALRRDVKYCRVCHNICDGEVRSTCASLSHDHSLVCMVENIKEVMAIENTGQFRDVYHMLDGVTSPMDGTGPGDLRIDGLVRRVTEDEVERIILALSTTMEDDTTNFFIYRGLSGYGVRISIVARGVSIGDKIEYADEITLGRSVINRIELNLTSPNS